MNPISEAQDKEHDAWIDMCKKIAQKANLTMDELNKPTRKVMFEMIERWAYYEHLRRNAMKEFGNLVQKEQADKPEGVFWDG